MDNSMLDKALGFISSVQEARKEGRNDLMRTILPEVLQPEELKQAAAPMKEEASKTLHAPKYDRRMKFNTALERSGHKATSEEPVQVKENVLKIAAVNWGGGTESGRRTYHTTYSLTNSWELPNYPGMELVEAKGSKGRFAYGIVDSKTRKSIGTINVQPLPGSPNSYEIHGLKVAPEMRRKGIGSGLISAVQQMHPDKTLGVIPDPMDDRAVPRDDVAQMYRKAGFMDLHGDGKAYFWISPFTSESKRASLEEPAWLKEAVRKIAGDPDFDGITGREGVVTVEDELERTPPLPTEEPLAYDVANKPVMQKEALGVLGRLALNKPQPWEQ